MRSLLLVPGDGARSLERGLQTGADALVVDLADIAPARTDAARRRAAAFLALARRAADRPRLYVRVNGLATGLTDADLDAVMPAGPDGILLPKTSGGLDVAHLGAKLAVREAEHGLGDGATRILAVAAGTARGLFALGSFTDASPRLEGLAWDADGLSADLGAGRNRDAAGGATEPLRLARNLMLFAAAAAGVDAIDTAFADLRDLEGLALECRAARQDGFAGKLAVDPAQVAVINEAFARPERRLRRPGPRRPAGASS